MTSDQVAQPAGPAVEAARRAARLAVECAIAHGIAIATTVVDGAVRLICPKPMDSAHPKSAERPLSRARTAAVFERDKDKHRKVTAPGAPAFGAQFHGDGGAGIMRGGLPVRSVNGLQGAVGVSGTDRKGDIACTKAACLALIEIVEE